MNVDLIRAVFPPFVSDQIVRIPIHLWFVDRFVWSIHKSGMYSVKSEYHFALELLKHGGRIQSSH